MQMEFVEIRTWSHIVKEQETLVEVRRLINEQIRTLQGRLSDAGLI
jgi:hypothetical protein